MKVVLDKKAFNLDEIENIKQFKAEWTAPTMDDIKSATTVTVNRLDIVSYELIAIREIELTKNRYKPTYWITTVIKGTDRDGNEIYAEISFDYVQAIMASFEDKIDNFTQIYKKV